MYKTIFMYPELKEDEYLDCNIYPVSQDKKYTYTCAYDENENKCYEKKLSCGEIYKPSDNTVINCQEYTNDEILCISNYLETSNACIQKKRCAKVTEEDLMNQAECFEFPVSNPELFSCVKNEEKKICEEIYYCLQAPKDEEKDWHQKMKKKIVLNLLFLLKIQKLMDALKILNPIYINAKKKYIVNK